MSSKSSGAAEGTAASSRLESATTARRLRLHVTPDRHVQDQQPHPAHPFTIEQRMLISVVFPRLNIQRVRPVALALVLVACFPPAASAITSGGAGGATTADVAAWDRLLQALPS